MSEVQPYPYKRGKCEHRHTHEDKARDQGDASTKDCHEATRSEGGGLELVLPQKFPRKHGPAGTLISDF